MLPAAGRHKHQYFDNKHDGLNFIKMPREGNTTKWFLIKWSPAKLLSKCELLSHSIQLNVVLTCRWGVEGFLTINNVFCLYSSLLCRSIPHYKYHPITSCGESETWGRAWVFKLCIIYTNAPVHVISSLIWHVPSMGEIKFDINFLTCITIIIT